MSVPLALDSASPVFVELGETELTTVRGGGGGLTLFAMGMAVGGTFVVALILGGIAAYVIYHSNCEC